MIKKLVASVLAILLAFSALVTVNAAESGSFTYTAEAQKLNDLGLYKGISETTFDPDLGTALTRETGVVLLLRIFGLEDEAEAITDADATLAKFSDAANISSWAKNAVACAVKNGLVAGYPDGTFGPKVALNGKAYCTLIMKQLGFTPDYNNAPAELADKGGLTPDEALRFAGKELIKDDLVGISYGSLSATDKEGKKVIEDLVAAHVVDEEAAIDAGLKVPPPSLGLKAAEAIGNKTVEVTLDFPAEASSLFPGNIQVKDSEGMPLQVSSVSAAAWSGDNKVLLVSLENALTAGVLYTLSSGTMSINFGGRVIETNGPKLLEVSSESCKEVWLTFDRPVRLDSLNLRIFEKYGSQAELGVTGKAYYDRNTIVLATSEQKNLLYELTASSASDFDGNVIKADIKQTFFGTPRNTNLVKLESAFCNEPDIVFLKFNVDLDRTTITAAKFTVAEKYGTKRAVEVVDASPAVEGDVDETGAVLTRKTAGKYIILTVPGLRSATLYKVDVYGAKSSSGMDESTASGDNTKNFVGIGKPVGDFTFTIPGEAAASNNTVVLSFENRVPKADAENTANYAIVERYGTNVALQVNKAELGTDGKTVTLTTASMENIIYRLTVTGMIDLHGNKINAASNTRSFEGKAIGARIEAITSISINSSTAISVSFDQNLGDNATDIANYMISEIGHPYSVTKIGEKTVYLSIPETTANYSYKLTVTGLNNTDGVPMDPAGVSMYFTGYYEAPPAPQQPQQPGQQGQDITPDGNNQNGAQPD